MSQNLYKAPRDSAVHGTFVEVTGCKVDTDCHSIIIAAVSYTHLPLHVKRHVIYCRIRIFEHVWITRHILSLIHI